MSLGAGETGDVGETGGVATGACFDAQAAIASTITTLGSDLSMAP
jgi:hypothetical protein